MTIEEVLASLALPSKTIMNRRTTRKSLQRVCGFPGDAERIAKGIKSMQFLALINQDTSGIRPSLHADLRYETINISSVIPRPDTDVEQLLLTLHRVIPQPTIIFVVTECVTDVSVWHKRVSREDHLRFELDGPPNRSSLGKSEFDQAFLASLHWDAMPLFNLRLFYLAWNVRVEALRSANLTGVFKLCRTLDEQEQRRLVLNQFRKLLREEAKLRRYPTTDDSAERFIVTYQIRKITEDKAVAVDLLRAIDRGVAPTPSDSSVAMLAFSPPTPAPIVATNGENRGI